MQEVIKKFEAGTTSAIKALKDQLSKIRTGRANVAILDGVMVDYYGSPTPLKQVSNLSTPEPSVITVQAWEKNILPAIEKAIIGANLGLTPQNDGKAIRLPIPPLSEERRKELVKQAKKLGEDCKISIRNQRRDSNEFLKNKEKEKDLSKDECKHWQNEVQKKTDHFIKQVDDTIAQKEKEILTV